MASYLGPIIKALGILSLAKISYNVASLTWLHILRPSQLPKYRHADPSWALVTGSSDGIGLELARELLAQGFNVFLHGRNETKLQSVKATLLSGHPSRSVELLVADASDPNLDYEALATHIASVPGRLTILINCVGGITTNPIYVPLHDLPGSAIDANIAINARFPTRLTAALLPQLKTNSPSLILNAGSFAGLFGLPYIATYTATKAYVHTFSRALRAEMQADVCSGVEVQGSLIGDTASSRNEAADNGLKVSARDCARGMLGKVGCGETLIAPDWRHWITGMLVLSLPDGIGRTIMLPEMRKRREEERAKAEKER